MRFFTWTYWLTGLVAVGALFSVSSLHAQIGGGFDLSWSTIDGGGQTFSAGGDFALSGTAGQPDAGAASGGSLVLASGFWGILPAETPATTPTPTPSAPPTRTFTETPTTSGTATASHTASLTPTGVLPNTATPTTTAPMTPPHTSTATASPSPTPTASTPTPVYCVGDCGNDGRVTVDELVRGVNIALGALPVADCPEFDENQDTRCTVDELVKGVNNALNGCPVEPIGQLAGYTGCKGAAATISMPGTAQNQDCLEWEYSDGALLLSHINACFNCCPGNIQADFTTDQNSVRIREAETEGLCSCLCLFDLEYSVTNVQASVYTVTVLEPYVTAEEQKLSTTVTLDDGSSGSFCVERKRYPWVLE